MSKFELQLETTYGNLSVPFDSVAELEDKLKGLDFKALEQTLGLYVKTALKGEPRKLKPTLEGLCFFRPDGGLEFTKPASSKVEMIGLIMYAFDPDPVDLQTIGALAADKNPASYVGHKQYAKYFQKIGAGLYGLSHEGRIWVSGQVLPKLKS